MDLDDVAALAAEIKAEHGKKTDEVKAIAEQALAEAQKGIKSSDDLKGKADETLTQVNALKAQVDAMEQKMVRGGGDDAPQERKTIGQHLVESEEFKSKVARDGLGRNEKVRVEAKAAITIGTGIAGGVGSAVQATRLPGIVESPMRRMTVRQLMAQGNMDGQVIEYVRKHSATRNAAMVAEGGAKPQSDVRLELVSAQARVMAHTFKVSRQALTDVSGLRSMIDVEGTYGLDLIEEFQLLYGDNTGQNLHGIVPQATAYVTPIVGADTQSIDKMRLMMLQASLALYPADGIVLNEADWGWIELLKDTTGRYIIGNPQGTIGATLWGLPVVATPAMTIDKVLVGSFKSQAQIFDRWETIIEVGYENDDFTKNMSTILFEKRLALAVKQPASFIYGDFGRVV